MSADRTEDGVRVRVKETGESGTALYGPHYRYGRNWPEFGSKEGWLVPVRYDRADMGVELFSPSELEPGPSPFRELGDRRVRSKADRRRVGTILPGATFGGVDWPGFDRLGGLRVPVRLDDGTVLVWRVEDMEPAPEPEPSPALVPGGPQLGPRVMVRDGRLEVPGPGHVLYRWAGIRDESRTWPNFADGKWLVPVRMDVSNTVLLVPPTGLSPYAEPEPDKAHREAVEVIDILSGLIHKKVASDVADAAADALELFASRLRAIAQEGETT